MSSQIAVRPTAKNLATDFSIGCPCDRAEPRAIAKCRSVVRVVVMCLAALSGVMGMLQLGAQTTPDTEREKTTGGAMIIAKPEQVKVTGGVGSTEIGWFTGDRSPGFVFVTGPDKKPILFATGARGSEVVPWIRPGKYAFELYSDQDRRVLLGKVTVSGNRETEAASQHALRRGKAPWLLVLVLFVIIYIAVYFSSTTALRTTFPAEPTMSPRPLHVARNLFLGLAAFLCVDGAIFHSGLYVSILAPDSYAGRVATITRAETDRAPSGLKEVLVLGDSRMAEGFSAPLANELGAPAGLKFVSLAEPAASANTWYYMVREVDPTTRRYWAIVIPYGIGYEPNSADPLRISMTAPLLRYSDCFHFSSGFQRWSGRFRAFTACILRGSAYQDDVADLLANPGARSRSIDKESQRLHSRTVYKGRDYDLVGTLYDPKTGQVSFAEKLTEPQRLAFRKSLIQPSQSDTQYSLKLQREWIPRIMNRYSKSSTAIVLMPVPRGPFVELPAFSKPQHTVLPNVIIQRTTFSLPERTFDFLEKPEYYFDAFHLNAKGRQRFTEALVAELAGRLGSATSNAQSRFKSQLH